MLSDVAMFPKSSRRNLAAVRLCAKDMMPLGPNRFSNSGRCFILWTSTGNRCTLTCCPAECFALRTKSWAHQCHGEPSLHQMTGTMNFGWCWISKDGSTVDVMLISSTVGQAESSPASSLRPFRGDSCTLTAVNALRRAHCRKVLHRLSNPVSPRGLFETLTHSRFGICGTRSAGSRRQTRDGRTMSVDTNFCTKPINAWVSPHPTNSSVRRRSRRRS